MATPDEHTHPRPTLGLFTREAVDYASFWMGVVDTARERDAHLIIFAGGILDFPDGFEAQGNLLYDLVDVRRIDGLVVNSAVLGHYAGVERAQTFCERYRPLPMVAFALERPLQGIPTWSENFYQGMYDLITHLIETHGYRRIAFIRGPERSFSADERYRAYVDALEAHHLPFDPALVAHGTFYAPAGQEAVHLFLEERRLRLQADIEAIVAANDLMALDALSALQARGIRVPTDVAVAGFDDFEESRSVTPPLTTVYLPTYERGCWGVETVLAQLKGQAAPEFVHPSLELVVRQSCGCAAANVVQAAVGIDRAAPASPSSATLAQQQDLIVADMVKAVDTASTSASHPLARLLLDAFFAELEAEPSPQTLGVFLPQLEEILNHVAAEGRNVEGWQGALSALRRRALPYLNDPALSRMEDVWQQGRVLIGDIAQRVQIHRRVQANQQAQLLREITQQVATSVDVEMLMQVLAQSLPQLGIQSCYLSLYEDPLAPTEWARLILAYTENGPIELDRSGVRFQSRQLIPDGLWPQGRRYSFVLVPLYFRQEQLGFVLFEIGPRNGTIYEALRGHISSALKSVMLYHEAIQARRAAEQAQQAAEEANRLKSSFLSLVSHELRTPLNLIVGLSEMAQWERSHAPQGESDRLIETLQQYHGQIYASAQHLDRLIRDVLDLASSQVGQLKLSCERLNPAELLRQVALMGQQMAREKQLDWRADIPDLLPAVWGDRTRLRQIMLNLISNAVKFTAQGGVTLQAQASENEITITIRDTGLGIPLQEQAAIFDEFRQSERTSARGYGGMGLGLAITRRLVEMHGGQVRVQSGGVEGKGSTFCFTLPTLKSREALSTTALGTTALSTTALSTTAATAASPAQTVVLVTHELSPLYATGDGRLREFLAERGFGVVEWKLDTTEGWLSRLMELQPGAIVLDCSPACEQGWDIIQALKERPATRDIPVLFYSLLEEQGRGAVLSMDYVSKPVGAQELAQALARCNLGQPAPGKAKTILVVDDEPGILELHVHAVQAELPGCRVLTAGEGRAALDIMRQELPDLVLLDLMMPEMDGFAVLKAMHEVETTRRIPVIVLTGQVLTEQDMDRLNQGVAAVLSKGLFSAAETFAQVEAALAHNKRLGSEAQRLARRAMAYMHEHYAESISRADIARHLGLDEDYLTRCFDREVGVTPMAYLSRYRIKQARQLLETTRQSITDIALKVGFSSSSHFNNVFRSQVGLSPTSYRRGAHS